MNLNNQIFKTKAFLMRNKNHYSIFKKPPLQMSRMRNCKLKNKIKTNKRSKQMINNKQGKKVTITQISLKFNNNNHSRRLQICFQLKICNLEVLRWRS